MLLCDWMEQTELTYIVRLMLAVAFMGLVKQLQWITGCILKVKLDSST